MKDSGTGTKLVAVFLIGLALGAGAGIGGAYFLLSEEDT